MRDFETVYDDESVWQSFVAQFIEKNPDRVQEIVDDYLASQLGDTTSDIQEDYNQYVTDVIQGEMDSAMDLL